MKTPILLALTGAISLAHATAPADELERRASVTLPFS